MVALKKEVVNLKEDIRKSKRETSYWKCKYKEIHSEYEGVKPITDRSGKAKMMIKKIKENGFVGSYSQIRKVAKTCLISFSFARRLWYED
jgi:hypothetical protein